MSATGVESRRRLLQEVFSAARQNEAVAAPREAREGVSDVKLDHLPPEARIPAQKLVDAALGKQEPVFRRGDVITIPGKYAMNPVARQPTGQLQQFVVTEDSDGIVSVCLTVTPWLGV